MEKLIKRAWKVSPMLMILLITMDLLLILVFTGGGTGVVSASDPTWTQLPEADAYVKQDDDNKNFGAETNLMIGYSDDAKNKNMRAWLRFDISYLPSSISITSAKLWLYFYEHSGTQDYSVHFSSDDKWKEKDIKWKDQPDFNPTATDTISGFEENGVWKFWTVTSDVQSQYAGDKTVTWVIKGTTDYATTEAADHENYARSKEYNGYDPYLEVTYVSVTAPTVTNSTGASNVTSSTARLNGEVTSTGGENPTVHIYWGDNDGVTTAGNWDHMEDLGTKGAETFYKDISNLTLNTTYYYRSYATNSGGSDWANSSAFFTTPVSVTAPTVTNSTGASNVTSSTARLNGEVTSTGGENPTVHIYWGDNDGVTTAGNWDHMEDLGTKGAETFYKDISNLTLNTTYYYRCYATNSGGSDWANSSAFFTTSALTGSITINNGATYTNSRNVTLTLEATDVSHMCFSNDSSSWSEWEDYTTEKSWRLTSGDGTKIVYVKFKDSAGNVSETYSDNIILDTTPPIVTITSPPASAMVNKEITITWEGSDPDDLTPAEDLVYQHKLVGHPDYSEWSDWSSETSKTYTLSSGNYTFKVRAKDEAGNYPTEDDPATAKSSFTVSLLLIIYPNPCYPDQGQIVTIANLLLTSDVKIYIYDVGGNLIRTLGESEANIEGGSKLAVWDCRNDNGEVVARGIYIYFIPSATEKKTGKIAIIK